MGIGGEIDGLKPRVSVPQRLAEVKKWDLEAPADHFDPVADRTAVETGGSDAVPRLGDLVVGVVHLHPAGHIGDHEF